MTEVCCLGGCCWKGSIWWWYPEQWDPSRLTADAKKRTCLGQEMAEGGETRWCLCFLSLLQSLAAAWDVIPIHPTFPAVSAAILILWGFLFNSGLTLPSLLPLPGLPKQWLGLVSCSLSSGGKTQGCPHLSRSPRPSWQEVQNRSGSNSTMRGKILLAWIIPLRMQA